MQTKLHDWHVRAGARMVDFGGWDMPVQYATGPREEHLRVRDAAGLFDIDHMGQVRDHRSATPWSFLQRVQTWDVSRLAEGRAHYSLLCTNPAASSTTSFVYHRPSPGS